MKKTRPLTPLELALLGLIHQDDRTGYDLCKIFETTPMGHYSSSPGAIYPALKRLEGRGLLSASVEKVGSMRPRKVYSLTPKGLEALKAWVTREVSHDDLVWRLDELLLRFSFMGQLVDRAVATGFLRRLAEGTAALIQGLEDHHRTMGDEHLPAGALPTGRLALEHGIGAYRNLMEWARRSLQQLEPPPNEEQRHG